jgi:hypothetical protein
LRWSKPQGDRLDFQLFETFEVDTLLNPVLIVEVLSESTEACRVEHYVRQGDSSSLLTDHPKLDDRLRLQSIDCSLSLREVYERVKWPGFNAQDASSRP